ncbi:hypothetical protein IWZ00DRAFT_575356 [Phyllosticta capitalensis]
MAPRKTKSGKHGKNGKKAHKNKQSARQSSRSAHQSSTSSENGGVPLYQEQPNLNQEPAQSPPRREASPVESDKATVQSSPRRSVSPDDHLTDNLPDDNSPVDPFQAPPSQLSPRRRRSPKKSKKRNATDKKPIAQSATPANSFNPTKILKRAVEHEDLSQATQQEDFPVTRYSEIRASQSRLLKRTDAAAAALPLQPPTTHDGRPLSQTTHDSRRLAHSHQVNQASRYLNPPAQNPQVAVPYHLNPSSHGQQGYATRNLNPPAQNSQVPAPYHSDPPHGQQGYAPRHFNPSAQNSQVPAPRHFNPPTQDSQGPVAPFFNPPTQYPQGHVSHDTFDQPEPSPLRPVTREFYHHAAPPRQPLYSLSNSLSNFNQAAQHQRRPDTSDVYHQAAPAQHHSSRQNYPTAPPQQYDNHLGPATSDFHNHVAPPQQQSHLYSTQVAFSQLRRNQESPHPAVPQEPYHEAGPSQPLYSTQHAFQAALNQPAHQESHHQAVPQQPLHSTQRTYQAGLNLHTPVQRHDSAHSQHHPELTFARLLHLYRPDSPSNESAHSSSDNVSHRRGRQHGTFPVGLLRKFANRPHDVDLLPLPLLEKTATANVYCKGFGGYFSEDDIDIILKMSSQDPRVQQAMRSQQAQRVQQAQRAQQAPLSPTAAPFNPPTPTLPTPRPDFCRTWSNETLNKYAWTLRRISQDRTSRQAEGATSPSEPPSPAPLPMRRTVFLGPDMEVSSETWDLFQLALCGRLALLKQEATEYEERAAARTFEELSGAARANINEVAAATGKSGPFEFTDEELFGAFGFKPPSPEQAGRLLTCYREVLAEHQEKDKAAPPPPMQGSGLGFGVEVPASVDRHFLADVYLARGGPKLQRDHPSLAIRAAGPFGKGLSAEDEDALVPAAAAAPTTPAAAPSAPGPSAAATPSAAAVPAARKPLGKAPAPALVPASLPPSGGSKAPLGKKVPAATLASAIREPWAKPSPVPSAWKAEFDRSVWNGKQLPKELRRNQPPPKEDGEGEEGPFKSFIPGLGPDH